MPECQAKFCTVRRGQGFNTFSIPDPKHDYELCKRWIHNLGNKKLNIKTFVFAYHKIVCEKHFEEDCFEDDVEARLMNFKPRKKLKKGAVPTIFKDSKTPKRREASEKRIKKKEKSELLKNILANAEDDKLVPEDEAGCSYKAWRSEQKRKEEEAWRSEQKRKEETIPKGKPKKAKVTRNSKNTVDTATQYEYIDDRTTKNMGTQCDIRAEKPIEFCVNCRARKYPSLTTSDHRYFKKFQDIPST
eukprot:XP_011428697.1 PREDICTED: uncharacterized protein LOC105329205 [Crassostrea gigas]